MNTFKFWFNIMLMLIAFTVISWIFTNFNKIKLPTTIDDNQPNQQISSAITYIYDSMGNLIYKLVTDKAHHFSNNKTTWFTNPVLVRYNTKNIPIWNIRASQSKLVNNNVLCLHGNVQINNLNENLSLRQIKTENAIVNLITQDISSDDKVVITCINLKTIGTKMRGNIRNSIIELIEDVKTYYKISNNLNK